MCRNLCELPNECQEFSLSGPALFCSRTRYYKNGLLMAVLRQLVARTNRRFQFQKRGQLFIRMHNETLSVAAMCVRNPDRLPFAINR